MAGVAGEDPQDREPSVEAAFAGHPPPPWWRQFTARSAAGSVVLGTVVSFHVDEDRPDRRRRPVVQHVGQPHQLLRHQVVDAAYGPLRRGLPDLHQAGECRRSDMHNLMCYIVDLGYLCSAPSVLFYVKTRL